MSLKVFSVLIQMTEITLQSLTIKRNQDSSPALSEGALSQTAQWTPEAAGGTKPCAPYIFFLYTHSYDKVQFIS